MKRNDFDRKQDGQVLKSERNRNQDGAEIPRDSKHVDESRPVVGVAQKRL